MTALTTIAKGDASRIAERRRVLVRNPEEWTALWAAHAGPSETAPSVDFSSSIVAAAFAGERPSAGYGIDIVGAVEEEGGTRLLVEDRAPAAGTANAQILTSPFHIVSLALAPGELRWTEAGRRGRSPGSSSHHADPIASAARSHAGTASGLRPRTAAVLAYLAGPLSGAIMLLAEPAQPFVRFHAWQSILAIGGLGVAMLACYALAFASLFFTANGLALMVRAAMIVWIVLLIVWLVCLWQAWSGRVMKLPLAGWWAERLARRPSYQPPATSS